MLHCPKCDELVNRQCKFCPHCGLPLADDPVPTQAGSSLDPTLLGAPAASVSSGDAARRRTLLYAAAGAGSLVALVAVTAIVLGATRGNTRRPADLKTTGPRSTLYGHPGGFGGTLGSPWSPQVAPRPVTPSPGLSGSVSRPPAAPVRMASAQMLPTRPPDVLAPPIMLYQPNLPDQPPPLIAPATAPVVNRFPTPLPFIGSPPVAPSEPGVNDFGAPAVTPPAPTGEPAAGEPDRESEGTPTVAPPARRTNPSRVNYRGYGTAMHPAFQAPAMFGNNGFGVLGGLGGSLGPLSGYRSGFFVRP